MKTTFTNFGWKTETVIKKNYLVNQIGPLMFVDTWVEINDRLFPNDKRRMKCGLCGLDFHDVPILEKVYCVIFKKVHRNKIVCHSCRCNILKSMGLR